VNRAALLLGSYLRQRRELGEGELVLDGIDRQELIRLLAQLSTPDSGPASAPLAPPAHARPAESPPARPTAPAGMGVAAAPVTPRVIPLGDLEELRSVALGCTACGLAATRRQVVFGEGNPAAELMVVGEAPGADEDRTGRPFVGRAGRLLDRLLASAGFSRESVYICNVLKCRPPANRNPESEEIEACSPYLRRQVELIAPRAILTVGMFASQTLLGSQSSINALRGRVHRYGDTPVVPTYHPAALLRNPGWIRPVWDDLQLLRSLLDDESARA
jgi:DNA polymerase